MLLISPNGRAVTVVAPTTCLPTGLRLGLQSASPGELQAKVFVVFAVLLVACLPVIARVPEHRGAW